MSRKAQDLFLPGLRMDQEREVPEEAGGGAEEEGEGEPHEGEHDDDRADDGNCF